MIVNDVFKFRFFFKFVDVNMTERRYLTTNMDVNTIFKCIIELIAINHFP